MRQQRAPVAFLQSQPPQISPRHCTCASSCRAVQVAVCSVAHFLQHDGIAALLQARKNLVKK